MRVAIQKAIVAAISYMMLEDGGVMTSDGAVTLSTADNIQKYANGGIADRPQMAMFGEGSTPEAFVPLPDGRTIPVTMSSSGTDSGQVGQAPNVSVNVINQSGQNVNAQQQGSARWNGNSYVLDVILSAMSRPGSFRDSMRSAVR